MANIVGVKFRNREIFMKDSEHGTWSLMSGYPDRDVKLFLDDVRKGSTQIVEDIRAAMSGRSTMTKRESATARKSDCGIEVLPIADGMGKIIRVKRENPFGVMGECPTEDEGFRTDKTDEEEEIIVSSRSLRGRMGRVCRRDQFSHPVHTAVSPINGYVNRNFFFLNRKRNILVCEAKKVAHEEEKKVEDKNEHVMIMKRVRIPERVKNINNEKDIKHSVNLVDGGTFKEHGTKGLDANLLKRGDNVNVMPNRCPPLTPFEPTLSLADTVTENTTRGDSESISKALDTTPLNQLVTLNRRKKGGRGSFIAKVPRKKGKGVLNSVIESSFAKATHNETAAEKPAYRLNERILRAHTPYNGGCWRGKREAHHKGPSLLGNEPVPVAGRVAKKRIVKEAETYVDPLEEFAANIPNITSSYDSLFGEGSVDDI